ncbi:hypothetical protein WH47_08882 [Habropoda laboriosa]|uniref:Uncharacterized protein n=1 Tax=Habropoda laboriosa TaxID=597456 RepID=A0A0L7R6N5_9HYME|nr:hypothetical protein WH47_08882 [Habropoda laboriosa]
MHTLTMSVAFFMIVLIDTLTLVNLLILRALRNGEEKYWMEKQEKKKEAQKMRMKFFKTSFYLADRQRNTCRPALFIDC